ncbi:MAG: nitrilase-related carbon-nitrogen hydrolase, partial [Gammaproteobacteria bacterium]
GLAIGVCYDLRFPELFRCVADGEVNLLAIPAAFTVTTGAAHWDVLLRARAIENQCFVAAAAQTGLHPGGRRTFGHSMIVGPWGDVLLDLDDAAGYGCADVDADELRTLRERFPVLRQRRNL